MKAIINVFLYVFLHVYTQGTNGLKFIVEPEDTIVSNGSDVMLNCAARGDGQRQPRISWKKDGMLINLTGDVRKSIMANGSLHITKLVQTREFRPDEGLYQCQATLDGVGTILSRFSKLQAASLSRFEEEPEDISIAIGQTARFGCTAKGKPQPKATWYKDGLPLNFDSSRMTILPSGSLEIQKIVETDSGSYHCVLTNIHKSLISRTGRLVFVTHAGDTSPVFIAIPKLQTATASKSVVLECSAMGRPHPKISWLKNGATIDLTKSKYEIVGEANLKISDVDVRDGGTYQCRAENREDSIDTSALLDVHVPPKVQPSNSIYYAYEKEDISLPCKMFGRPLPTIQWFKNGEPIMEGDYFRIVDENSLKILGIVNADEGVYQCFGTNAAGNAQISMYLSILRPDEKIPDIHSFIGNSGENATELSTGIGGALPSAPRDLTAVFLSSRFVTLRWKRPIHPNAELSHIKYTVIYQETGSSRKRVLNITEAFLEEINVQGLSPNKRYTFRVVAYNDKGSGDSSEEIEVSTTGELNVPSQIRKLRAWAESPTTLHAKWEPPKVTNGLIQRYTIYYQEVNPNDSGYSKLYEDEGIYDEEYDSGFGFEDYYVPQTGPVLQATSNTPEIVLRDLKIFTEYFIWVSAVNQDGPGPGSEEIVISTLSDVPSDTPKNVTVEPASSQELVLRWEPPPHEGRNGIITGFKIKYKKKGKRRAVTKTRDGNTLLLRIGGLERETEYQIKLAALNTNGSGPFTKWHFAKTFSKDLDENRVPDKPGSLDAVPGSDSVSLSWTPPLDSDVVVRGYTIGWGKGIPDSYTKLVDVKRRNYKIKGLLQNAEYVISLRGYNERGDGEPIYAKVSTHDASEDTNEVTATLNKAGKKLPAPMRLRAYTLSPSSIVLYWTDPSMPVSRSKDKRYYVVQYKPTDPMRFHSNFESKYANTTEMDIIIDKLRPATEYEFSVKVFKSRYSSDWSLVAVNTTFQSPPQSYPQDLTLVALTNNQGTSSIILNWQPPKTGLDADLEGYIVHYTTNPSLTEWVQEPIPADALTHQVQGLTPDTTYYFKMAARLKNGIGPYTDIKSVSTKASKHKSPSRNFTPALPPNEFQSNELVLYILISLSLLFAIGSLSLCIYYRKKGTENASPKQKSKKGRQLEVKPPDLWIHHDQMELKNVDKGNQLDTPISPSNRGSREFGDIDEQMPLQHSTNSLDKGRYVSNYLKEQDINHFPPYHSLGRRKPKPFKIPVEPFFSDPRNVGPNVASEPRAFSRGSHSHSSSHYRGAGEGGNTTATDITSGSSTTSSHHNLNNLGHYSGPNPNTEFNGQGNTGAIGTLSRRSGTNGGSGNLRSFTVPIPPGSSIPPTPTTPQSQLTVRPLGPVGAGASGIGNSPVKRVGTTHMGPGFQPQSLSPRTNSSYGDDESSSLQKCYSTEELSQEISNLEGLMKDLNAITASEFQC